MQIATLIFACFGLISGAGLGWFFGSRGEAEWRRRYAARDGEARELDSRCRQADTELATLRERASHAAALAAELAGVRGDRDALQAQLATLSANAGHFEEQKRLLLAAQETLRKEFESAGSKVLESAQEAFLKRAQDRFAESEKTSAERLRSLLEPVGQRLKNYEDQVTALEAKRVDSFGNWPG